MARRDRRLLGLAILAAATLTAVGVLLLRGEGASPGSGRVAPRPPADEVAEITQILVGYRLPSGQGANPRSKEEARALATRLIERLHGGERMETLLLEHTDDRGEDGKPFNNGTYSIARRRTPTMQVVKDAVFALKPGELCPRPIDTGVAFLIVRRDA